MEEAVEEGWQQEWTQSLDRIAVAELWCDGLDLYKMRLHDAIACSCILSTSDHEDTAGIGCESTWAWLYGTTMIFLQRICADSYESAICGFSFGGIVLLLRVIQSFSYCEIWYVRNKLLKLAGMDTFEIWKMWV